MTHPRYGPPDLPANGVPGTDLQATDLPGTDLPKTGVPTNDLPANDLPGAMKALKVTMAVVLVCAGVGGAVVAGVIGAIVYTGCFIGCSDADPVGGVLLGLLAFVLLVGGPWLAIVMWRTARTWRAVKVWAGILLGLPALYLFLGLAQSAIGF